MADLSAQERVGGGGREKGERSSIIVQTLGAQSRTRARQDRTECTGLGLYNEYSSVYSITGNTQLDHFA